MTETVLYIDGESHGTLDLSEVGSPRFWAHRASGITTACYAVKRPGEPVGPIQTWTPVRLDIVEPIKRLELSNEIKRADRIVAFGDFERYWIRAIFGVEVVEKYDCLLSRALYCSLPAKLETLLEALKPAGATFEKDKEGNSLAIEMAMPASWNPIKWHWEVTTSGMSGSEKLRRLEGYCASDVLPMIWLDDFLPRLPPMEHLSWLMDARSNDLGVPIDVELVHAAVDVLDIARERTQEEWDRTVGDVMKSPRCSIALKKWLHAHGHKVKDTQQETLEELSTSGEVTDPLVEKVLKLRKASSRSSVAKLEKMLVMAETDGRVRGSIRFHGAHTGRKTNLGVQFQNFCRATRLRKCLFDLLEWVAMGDV